MDIREFHIGRIKVTSLFDGWLSLDGGAMFGVVPKTLWEKKIPADAQNRVKLALRPLLVQTPTDTLVVETGLGDALTTKQQALYDVRRGPALDEQVQACGINPAAVGHVALTHLHWDHSGGACKLTTGAWHPTFAGAIYHVNAAEWALALNPDNLQKQSYVPASLSPLEVSGRLRRHAGDGDIVPGIRFEFTGGHTENHCVIWIEDGDECGCFMGDLLETTAHVPLPWISAYDLCAGSSYRARQKLWPVLAARKAACFIYHDPVHAACRLIERNGKFDFKPIA